MRELLYCVYALSVLVLIPLVAGAQSVDLDRLLVAETAAGLTPIDESLFSGGSGLGGFTLGLRYEFLGARTLQDQVLTSVHCTSTADESALVGIEFIGKEGVFVGVGIMNLETFETQTATAHLDSVTADVAIFEEDVLVPLSAELDQGMIRVFSNSKAIVCSAQNLDATSNAPAFIDALEARVRFIHQGFETIFTSVRSLPALVETVVHCYNPTNIEVLMVLTLWDQAGVQVGSVTPVVNESESITVATADIAFFSEAHVVDPPGQIAQGSIRIGGSGFDLQCTAALVPTFGTIPKFLGRLGSSRDVPDLVLFRSGFETGDSVVWTSTVP